MIRLLRLENSWTMLTQYSYLMNMGSQVSHDFEYPFHPTRTCYSLPFRPKSFTFSTEDRIWSVISVASFIKIGVTTNEWEQGLTHHTWTNVAELSSKLSITTVKKHNFYIRSLALRMFAHMVPSYCVLFSISVRPQYGRFIYSTSRIGIKL